MPQPKLLLFKRLLIFYAVFFAASIIVTSFGAWQIVRGLLGGPTIVSWSVALVLFIGGIILVLEFCFGFAAERRELRRDT